MPDGAPIATFPVTDETDAPDGARLVDTGRVVERHGDTWWVLGPETLTLRKYADGMYTVLADGEVISSVKRTRRVGTRRMRPRWRWVAANVPYLDFATRRDAVEEALLTHYTTAHPQEGPTS